MLMAQIYRTKKSRKSRKTMMVEEVAPARIKRLRRSARLVRKRRRKLQLKLASVRLKPSASRSKQQTASKLRPTN